MYKRETCNETFLTFSEASNAPKAMSISQLRNVPMPSRAPQISAKTAARTTMLKYNRTAWVVDGYSPKRERQFIYLLRAAQVPVGRFGIHGISTMYLFLLCLYI